MNLKIISDGISANTSIIDEKTGKKINNCTHLEINVDVKEKLATCKLTLIKVPFDIINLKLNEKINVCLNCKKLMAINLKEGECLIDGHLTQMIDNCDKFELDERNID